MDSNWPKKQSIANYLERWWVEGDRSRQSIRNDIEKGHLPGGKEPSGTWFVWVWADGSPAYDYTDRPAPEKKTLTGNTRADEILKKHGVQAA